MSTDSPIVFYDGTCGVCDRTVSLLLRLDRHRTLRFAPFQGETASRALPDDIRSDPQSVILAEGKNTYRESAAVVRILWRLSGVWKVVAAMLWLIPAPLRNGVYRTIANNRYRILGEQTSCRLPSPEQRQQLLP